MDAAKARRRVDGIIFLDKPSGITSNAALQRLKRLFQAAKAGHTGTLDPLASGLLPICFGEATKFSNFLLDSDKSYEATIKLGRITTTGDAEGEILATREVNVKAGRLENVLEAFVGPLLQVPSMYSALKHHGKPLYSYARAGVEVARAAREITIRRIRLDAFDHDEIRIAVECSKGTYIRVLAEDIGKELGCGACLAALRRTAVGNFDLSHSLSLPQLERMGLAERDSHLRAEDVMLGELPEIVLDTLSATRLAQGRALPYAEAAPAGLARLYDCSRQFLGLGEIRPGGALVSRRLRAQPPRSAAESDESAPNIEQPAS